MPYELKIEKFTGPLNKLLELIEARQLTINEISLAEVTEDFLKYLQKITDADLRLVADFIAVASRLILIKSKSLLPDLSLTGDEEADIKDLERRLKIYQELKPALKILDKLWKVAGREFSRPYFLMQGASLEGGARVFYPGAGLEIEALFGALDKIFESFRSLELETKSIKEKIITVEEKIAEVIKLLGRRGESTFRNLSSAKPRSEIIVIFLAILHLARERLIALEQSERFSDIIIRKQ
jgi:segregation and condensation protein A